VLAGKQADKMKQQKDQLPQNSQEPIRKDFVNIYNKGFWQNIREVFQ
jgi:hypothetical protein